MEAHPRDKHYNVVKVTFWSSKISYGVLDQGYFCNLWLEQTGQKSLTLVYNCV